MHSQEPAKRSHRVSSQTEVPALFMRGGTSRGPIFHAGDLPHEQSLRDQVLVSALGSPHPLQVDGLGGGHPLTSKAGIVSLADDEGIDLEFTFLQLRPDDTSVQARANCGNMLSAVVPFAIETGLISACGDTTTATVRTLNTGLIAEITVQTPVLPNRSIRGVEYEGGTSIDGVNGTGSPISILFRDTAGSVAASLLPTGHRRDELALPAGRSIEVTMIDNGQPVVLIRAADLDLVGSETPDELEANTELSTTIEHLRLLAGERMGLGDVADKSYPKMTLVSEASADGALNTRSFIPHSVHRSIGVLAALTVATAACMDGTVAASVAVAGTGSQRTLSIEHPSGAFPVDLRFDGDRVVRSGLTRTARTLMVGDVHVPTSIWAGHSADSITVPASPAEASAESEGISA